MKILLGMSGGVDSAYAVHKLKMAGHTVEGAVLLMHQYTELDEAQKCADSLSVKLHVIDVRDEFDRCVVENLINEYSSARTPNPCVICNSEIKLIYLYKYAMEHGFDAIATGHYSKLVITDGDGGFKPYCVGDEIPEGEHITIAVGEDERKDQSYMLWRVPEYVLRRLVLPLAELDKKTVKQDAESLGIVSENKPESQEICFIRSGDYADFIEARRGKSPEGDFVSEDGATLGKHKGIIRYTIGQRKGLGISAASRVFVTDINIEKNQITLSPEDKKSTTVYVTDTQILGYSEGKIPNKATLTVKLRYGQKPVPAVVYFSGKNAKVVLDTPVRAVTAGQSCVFYKEGVLIGGGFIEFSE